MRTTFREAASSSYALAFLLLVSLLCILWSASEVHGSRATLGTEKPEHIVLTFQNDPRTTQSITWRTSSDVTDTVVQIASLAEFNHNLGTNMRTVRGESFLFATDIGTMRIHEAEVTGLAPGTSYIYRVGDGTEDGWSDYYTFTTESMENEPFTFLFATDTQAYPNGSVKNGYGIWGEIFAKGLEAFPDTRFLVLSGDIVDYGDQQQQWELWFDAAKDKLPQVPIVPTVGNHDVVRRGEEYFRAQFQLPKNGPPGEEELVYSFDYGNMHMAVLNSEGDLEKQAAWLKADMEASDQPWKLVAFHRSPYHSHDSRANKDIREAWAPVLEAAGVQLVLSGHDHAYMRSYPMLSGQMVEDGRGTTYIIGGTAGSKFYEMGNYPWIRVAFNEQVQLVSGITIDGDKLRMHVLTRDGRVADAFTMIRESGTQDDFVDLPVTHDAYDAVMTLRDRGIIKGATLTKFHPDRTITRAEFISLMIRASGQPIIADEQAALHYHDLEEDDWYYPEVSTAWRMGLTDGVSAHSFAPYKLLTRQELAVLIVRAYESQSGELPLHERKLPKYRDGHEAAEWAVEAINKALAEQWMSGVTSDTFAPGSYASRAEAALAIARLLDRW